METCPNCGRLLEVIECCGGGIFLCPECNEYFYPGELISLQSPSEEVSKEAPGLPSEVLLPPPPHDKPPKR
jgi:hypothetical protein